MRLKLPLRDILLAFLILFFIDSVFHGSILLTSTNHLRLVILLLMIFLSALDPFVNKFAFRNKYAGAWCLLLCVLALYYSLAIILQKKMQYANDFIGGFIYLFLYPIIISATYSRRNFEKLIYCSVIAGTFLSIYQIALFFARNTPLYNQLVDILIKFDLVRIAIVHDNIYFRILMKGVMLQATSIFLSIFLYEIHNKKRLYLITSIINTVGIFLSYTRGVYLGVCTAFLVLFIVSYSSYFKDDDLKKYLKYTLIFVVMIAISFYIYNHNIIDFAVGRLFYGVNSADSDLIRHKKLLYMYDLILENPIFGNGLSASDAVEMTYHEIISKIGLVGLVLFVYPFLSMMLIFFRHLSFKNKDSYIMKVELFLLCALTSIMVSTYTNPYLITSFGLFTYCLCIRAFLFKFKENTFENYESKCNYKLS